VKIQVIGLLFFIDITGRKHLTADHIL